MRAIFSVNRPHGGLLQRGPTISAFPAPMLIEYVGPDGGAYENWCTKRDS
jgi:hypothetical protein